MKKTVFLLDKDFTVVDSITKRFLIETEMEIKGKGSDAGSAYGDIQNIKPDLLIFSYPSNFTASQLIDAMSTVRNDMKYLALLEPNSEDREGELRAVGIESIIKKPCNGEDVINMAKNMLGIVSLDNPFMTSTAKPQPQVQSNPFLNTNTTVNNSLSSKSIPSAFNNINGVSANSSVGIPNVGASEYTTSNSALPSFRTIKQNLIAIHCPKGGVGKTSISTNVAALLSTVRLGTQPLKVLLVDMDWSFGDDCVNFGLQPRPSVMNWIENIKNRVEMKEKPEDITFTQAQIEEYLITYKTGLKILAAPPSHNDAINIPDYAAKIIIDNLKNCDFDVILFDCGNNIETHTLQALMSCHSVYEVITMDISAMNDVSMLISTLKTINFPLDKAKLILNRVPKTDKEFQVEDISKALGLEVVSVIQDCEKVRISNNAGEPLVLSKTSNSFTAGIKNVCNTMLGNNLFKQRASSGGSKSGGFFSRLFGR